MEINISKFAGDNLDWQRNEGGQHSYIEKSKSLQPEAVWKEQQTKTCSPTVGGEGGGGKKEDAQYRNVKCKTENEWMKSSGHTSAVKACIQSATSKKLAAGSSSEPAWASVPDLLAQCRGKGG